MRARRFEGERAPDLFPVLAYAPETRTFILDNQTIAFGFVMSPMTGAGPSDRTTSGVSRLSRGSASGAPGSTTSSRAASRGSFGRSAIRSSGSSKSKRSTRTEAPGQRRV